MSGANKHNKWRVLHRSGPGRLSACFICKWHLIRHSWVASIESCGGEEWGMKPIRADCSLFPSTSLSCPLISCASSIQRSSSVLPSPSSNSLSIHPLFSSTPTVDFSFPPPSLSSFWSFPLSLPFLSLLSPPPPVQASPVMLKNEVQKAWKVRKLTGKERAKVTSGHAKDCSASHSPWLTVFGLWLLQRLWEKVLSLPKGRF